MKVEDNHRFVALFTSRFSDVLDAPINETIFFYPYSWINQSWVMEEKRQSSIDPEAECGLLIVRHNDESESQQTGIPTNAYHDTCLTHLKSLHFATSIHNLSEWKEKTDYLSGIRVGGSTCRLLQIYGTSIIFPILLNLSFNIVVYIDESNIKSNKAN